MSEQTLDLLKRMIYQYLPLYPSEDNNVVECGYCSMQSTNVAFFRPESHGAACTYAAGLRHLAIIAAEQQKAVQP